MGSRLDCITDGKWKRLARSVGYCVEGLSEVAGVTSRQLERNFAKRLALSPKAWLDVLRIRDAQRRLRQGMLIKQVALELAFKHPEHFARAFRRVTGASPSGSRLAKSILPAHGSHFGRECRKKV